MTTFLDQITQLDNELFLYLNGLGTEKWDNFWLWVTNKKTWIPFYFGLLIAVIFNLKKPKAIGLLILCVAAMILVVDQTSSGYFKPITERLRPCYFESFDGIMRLVKGGCGGKYSFFSGHASNSFALSVFFALVFRKWKWFGAFLLIWASMVAYSRIYVGVHFPLDVFMGAFWGSSWGYIFYELWQMGVRRFRLMNR